MTVHASSGKLRIRRVYDAPDEADGLRILVDRLWPRGLAKSGAHIDHWEKEIAPSDGLRRWFAHDTAKWDEFSRRYGDELRHNAEAVAALRRRIGGRMATLLYAAHDTQHNNAVVLCDFLTSAKE